MATFEREDLVLCHGTSQPVGNMVELEARDNPNGEPVSALADTAGIWAADNTNLCGKYTRESGGMVDDQARFGEGREPQIYHFDLPQAKVITLTTSDAGLDGADKLVREALAEDPDVLRLHRRVGTEYLIVRPSAAHLVRVTDAQGNDLPAPGLTLYEPSEQYCRSQADLLNGRVEQGERAVEFTRRSTDLWNQQLRASELLQPHLVPYTKAEAAEQITQAHQRAIALVEDARPLIEDWLNSPHFREYHPAFSRQDYENVLAKHQAALEQLRTQSAEWQEAVRTQGDDLDPEEMKRAIGAIKTQSMESSSHRAIQALTQRSLGNDYLVLEEAERRLSELQSQRDYWVARCETGQLSPTPEHCRAQRATAEAELTEARNLMGVHQEQLDDYRERKARQDAGEPLLLGNSRGWIEERYGLAERRLQVAEERFAYWEEVCRKLESGGRPAIAEGTTPYLSGQAGEIASERQPVRESAQVALSVAADTPKGGGSVPSHLKSKSGYAPRASRSRTSAPAEIKRFARNAKSRAGRK